MDKNPNRIAEEAAEYFARRVPNGKSTEHDDLAQWLQADPRHARVYDETQQLWDHARGLRDDVDLQALRSADLVAQRRSRTWFSPSRMLATAAILLLVLSGGYLFSLRFSASPPPVSYATGLGEQRTEMLQDGSEIVLNTDSVVQAQYTHDRRGIELQQGEAQFEVARDATRPFVVKVDESTITALGTRFQVRRSVDDVTVTLIEGSVEVAQGQKRLILKPNEQARLTRTGSVTVQQIDPAVVGGWLEGWLRFRSTPLHEVVAEANRYSSRKIRLGDSVLSDIQLNGNFRAGDSASIAAAAQVVIPVRVDDSGPEIVLLPE